MGAAPANQAGLRRLRAEKAFSDPDATRWACSATVLRAARGFIQHGLEIIRSDG